MSSLYLGCGVHWGVYIKDLASGLAKESGNVEMGDYINTVRSRFYKECIALFFLLLSYFYICFSFLHELFFL